MNTQPNAAGNVRPKPRFFVGYANGMSVSPVARTAVIAAGEPWLLNLIAALQSQPHLNQLPRQSWELAPVTDHICALMCFDAEGNQVYGELLDIFGHSGYRLHLCCINGWLQLPTEYIKACHRASL